MVLSENLFQESRLAYVCELDLNACDRSHEKDMMTLGMSIHDVFTPHPGEQNSEIVIAFAG